MLVDLKKLKKTRKYPQKSLLMTEPTLKLITVIMKLDNYVNDDGTIGLFGSHSNYNVLTSCLDSACIPQRITSKRSFVASMVKAASAFTLTYLCVHGGEAAAASPRKIEPPANPTLAGSTNYRCRGLVPQGILRSIEFAVTKNKISPCNWKAFNRITREESSSRD